MRIIGRYSYVIGVVLSGVLLYVIARQVDVRQSIDALAAANLGYVGAALAVSLATIVLKTWRWRILLATSEFSYPAIARALILGQFANAGLPLRLGDVARVAVLSRRAPNAVPRVAVSVLVERYLDAVVVGLTIILMVPTVVIPSWMTSAEARWGVGVAIGIVPIVGLAVGIWQKDRLLPDRLAFRLVRGIVEQTLVVLRTLASAPNAAAIVALSIVSWVGSVLINHLAALALGIRLPVLGSVLVLLTVTIGASVPSAPLRIGTFEYACVLALSEFSIPMPAALTYGVLLHLVAFALPVLIGSAILVWPAGSRLSGRVGGT